MNSKNQHINTAYLNVKKLNTYLDYKRMFEKFMQSIICHSERNEVERSRKRSEGKNLNFEMLHYAIASFSMTFLTFIFTFQTSSNSHMQIL